MCSPLSRLRVQVWSFGMLLESFANSHEPQDFKFSIGIMDHSYREMKIDFFEKNLQNMPTLPNLGDLVIVRDIKVGSYLIPAVWYTDISRLKCFVETCRC